MTSDNTLPSTAAPNTGGRGTLALLALYEHCWISLGLTAIRPALLLVLLLAAAANSVSDAGKLFFGGACSCIVPGLQGMES
jgi:hypothetical protein